MKFLAKPIIDNINKKFYTYHLNLSPFPTDIKLHKRDYPNQVFYMMEKSASLDSQHNSYKIRHKDKKVFM